MKNYLLLFASFLILAGCGAGGGFEISSLNPRTDISAPASSASYEMYSWQTGGEWSYSLFESATRISSFADITNGNSIPGTDSVVEKIIKLPRNTKVYWNLKRIKGFGLPEQKTVDRVSQTAQKSGVNIEVITWP